MEYSYGMTPPFEYYHEEALMNCLDAIGRFVENHPDRQKLEKKLDGYKSKIAAYQRLYWKELRKPGKGDYETFSKKYPPPYQKALTVYLEKSAVIKREMGVSDINQKQPKSDKDSPMANGQEKQYPVWLRDRQSAEDKGNGKALGINIDLDR